MLNLDHYQELFEIDETSERCRRVLDHIEPTMQRIFETFIDENQEISRERDLYEVKSSEVTLRTTYHSSRNPKYADSKKDSSIGRKYLIRLMKKVYEDEINVMTLELNGIDQTLRMYVESSFYPVWASVNSNKINELFVALPSEIRVWKKEGSHNKVTVARVGFDRALRALLRPPKTRPAYYFGVSFQLEGEKSEAELLEWLNETYHKTKVVSEYLEEERVESFHASNILNLFRNVEEESEVEVFNHTYSLRYGKLQGKREGAERQRFYLYDQDQMLVRGHIVYFDYQLVTSPVQKIALEIDGHTHLYISIRQLLGEGKKEWWVKKVFATQNLDNTQLMQDSLKELRNMGIETRNNEFYVATYNNEDEQFDIDSQSVKERLVLSTLIFAHVSKRLTLPTVAPVVPVDPDHTEDGEDDESLLKDLESNFDFKGIYDVIQSSSFTFSTSIIRDFHLNLTALDDKHFVILSGISGTGKTQLAKLYANAVYGLDFEDDNPYLSIIPVRPDWMDGTALFGYYSSFEKRYVMPEFLRMILQAQKERDKPHFILLDEMNLARVEYYLSDYLSAVESQKDIPLHDQPDIEEIPQKIKIPPNVYVIGTINVDETTHSISDKVLDRAYVMTLSDVDFTLFWNQIKEHLPARMEQAFSLLTGVHQLLLPYDLHFGYRSMNEMLRKLARNEELEEEYQMSFEEAIDGVIREKVLPKIRGDERIAPLLDELIAFIGQQLDADAKSLTDLNRMKKELERYGATQYWR